jgi:WD40 repeat protein
MSWPLSGDYNEAIQNPRLNFQDPELKQGEPVLNQLGLPVVMSGRFADVYPVRCLNTGRDWAVKCFTREVAGLHDRYREISSHLQRVRLPFTVDFTYLDEGISIRGQWFPVLKMQWVEGRTLNTYVRDHVSEPRVLEALTNLWVNLSQVLRDASVAHADLQDGNVLLVRDPVSGDINLKLIDYDGMFVPTLVNTKSAEVGHANFQHPRRLRLGTYNAEVDRFPHLVIACALRALVGGGRQLWDTFDNGDNLLFRETDLANPNSSPLFQYLCKSSDAQTRYLAGHLLLATSRPIGQEALLTDLLSSGRPTVLSPAEEQTIGVLLTAPGRQSGSLPLTAPQPPASLVPTNWRHQVPPVSSGPTSPPITSTIPGNPGASGVVYTGAFGTWSPKKLVAWSAGAAISSLMLIAVVAAIINSFGNSTNKTPVDPSGPSGNSQDSISTGESTWPEQNLTSETRNSRPTFRVASYEPAQPVEGGQLRVSVDGEDPDGDRITYEYRTNRDRVWRNIPGREITMTNLARGNFSVEIRATDTAGNTAVVQKSWYVNGRPSVYVRTSAANGLLEGDPVAVYVDADDPDGDPLTVEYRTEANAAWRRAAGTTITIPSVPAGNFTVYVRAVDTLGNLSDVQSKTWTVAANPWRQWQPRELARHSGAVMAVAISPDGKRFASAGEDSIVYCGSLDGRSTTKPFVGNTKSVYAVAFNHDGTMLASGGADSTIHIWRTSDGTLLRRIVVDGTNNRVYSVAFHPRGTGLASATKDGSVRLWQVPAGTLVAHFDAHVEARSVAFSPDGRYVASGGLDYQQDHRVKVWDVLSRRQEPVWNCIGHGHMVNCVAFSPDGSMVAGASRDQTVMLWQLGPGQSQPLAKIFPGTSELTSEFVTVAFCDGSSVVCASDKSNTVWFWRVSDGRKLAKFQYANGGTVNSLAFNASGTRMVSGASDFTVRVWGE